MKNKLIKIFVYTTIIIIIIIIIIMNITITNSINIFCNEINILNDKLQFNDKLSINDQITIDFLENIIIPQYKKLLTQIEFNNNNIINNTNNNKQNSTIINKSLTKLNNNYLDLLENILINNWYITQDT